MEDGGVLGPSAGSVQRTEIFFHNFHFSERPYMWFSVMGEDATGKSGWPVGPSFLPRCFLHLTDNKKKTAHLRALPVAKERFHLIQADLLTDGNFDVFSCFTSRFNYLDLPGDSNTDIYIRVLHPIPENTEVTISYFPINWSFTDRADRFVRRIRIQMQM